MKLGHYGIVCGGTTPTVEMDDADHGAVAEFTIENNNGTVLGFITRSSDGGMDTPFDATSIINGVFRFEMKVVSPPTSGYDMAHQDGSQWQYVFYRSAIKHQ